MRQLWRQCLLGCPELGVGCARIGGVFQNDPSSFVRLLAIARDAGINFFDTADMYSQGESEALLGRVFAARRSNVIIAAAACGASTGVVRNRRVT